MRIRSPVTEAESPFNPKDKKRNKRRRRFQWDDFQVVKRVLTYAQPYRTKIIIALTIGVFAGFLAAGNILAVIPVLQVILEGEKDKEEVQEILLDIDEQWEKWENGETFVDRFDGYVNARKYQIRYKWNEWILDSKEKAIYMMALLLVGITVLKSLLDFLSKYILQKYFFLAIMNLRVHLYNKCLDMNLPDFAAFSSGDLIARMNNDLRAVRLVYTNMISNVILQPFSIFFIFIAMLFLNWQLTLIAIVGVPTLILPVSYLGKKLRHMGKKDEEEDAKILSYTQEVIQGLMIVKAFTAEKRELRRFKKLSRQFAKRQIRREKYRLYSEPFVEVFASVAMAIVLCLGAYLILKSDNANMEPAEFMAYLLFLTRFYPPIKRLSNTFIKLQKSLASAERIFEVIDKDLEIKEKPDAEVLPKFSEKIELQNVDFAYTKDTPFVLKNFSLEIRKGQRIALVGRTGAGKSTIARLLPRFYDIQQGKVLIDGHDVRDVTLDSLRSQIAVVSQETILFNSSVAENIRYGQPDASDEEVQEAAKAAYADEFIQELPRGYDTIVGERGGRLSGGQRQRLTIARALLANSPILILDEATSALDNESERIVQSAIEKLMENRTVLVIAHRLSTVRAADEILVMEEGAVIERGGHEELLAKRGKYYDFLQAEELLDS